MVPQLSSSRYRQCRFLASPLLFHGQQSLPFQPLQGVTLHYSFYANGLISHFQPLNLLSILSQLNWRTSHLDDLCKLHVTSTDRSCINRAAGDIADDAVVSFDRPSTSTIFIPTFITIFPRSVHTLLSRPSLLEYHLLQLQQALEAEQDLQCLRAWTRSAIR